MIITIKYFGVIAEITNKKEEQLHLKEGSLSVASLKSIMETDYTELQNTSYTIALNQSLATLETTIKDQDVIAFLPPFAGG